MRDIRYKILPATGASHGSWVYASLDKFLTEIPKFRVVLRIVGIAPPLHVVNEILSSGLSDAGMGGGAAWKPFQIEAGEYQEVLGSWATILPNGISEDAELALKPNYAKWHGALLSKYSNRGREKS